MSDPAHDLAQRHCSCEHDFCLVSRRSKHAHTCCNCACRQKDQNSVIPQQQQQHDEVSPNCHHASQPMTPAVVQSSTVQQSPQSGQAEVHSPLRFQVTASDTLLSQVRQSNNAEEQSDQHTMPSSIEHEAGKGMEQSIGAQAGSQALQITLADLRVAETRVGPSAMREVALQVSPAPLPYAWS